MALRCIIHVGQGKSAELVKKVDDEKWKTLKAVAATRKSTTKTSKYDAILEDFPVELEDDFGYHSKCYKNFTAVTKVVDTSDQSSSSNVRTRSTESSPVASSTGVLPRICIFCRHVKSSSGELFGQCETKDAEKKIREKAVELKDTKLLSFIGNYLYNNGQDFVSLEAKYHHGCRRKYLNRCRGPTSNKRSKVLTKAFNKLVKHVRNSILNNNKPELLTSLLKRYKDLHLTCGGEASALESYTTQNLSKRLRTKFDESKLTILSESHKLGSLVFKFGTTAEEARKLLSASDADKNVMKNCAQILRKAISTSTKTPLKTESAEDVIKGEAVIPDKVDYFFKKLYNDKGKSRRKRRLVESSSADAVFCCSGSQLLPGKHIRLGLALKSISGSQRVVKLMNRNGHCASDETLRRIDMDIEESINLDSGGNVPKGIAKQSGRSVGTAWDNLDINMETLSGLGTIHHTYGIVYQNLDKEAECINVADSDQASDPINISTSAQQELETNHHEEQGTSVSKKRSFKHVASTGISEIQPYHKKPKITTHNFPKNEFFPPDTLSSERNLLWVMAKSLFPTEVPNWTGWNSQHDNDTNPKQVVGYLKPIQLSPTRTDAFSIRPF